MPLPSCTARSRPLALRESAWAGSPVFHRGYPDPGRRRLRNAARPRARRRLGAPFISHIHDPARRSPSSLIRRSRLLYRYAVPLYRLATDAGDQDAARRFSSTC